MGLKWIVFLIGPLYLIYMWFGEDERANILEKIGLCLQILITTLHSTMNTMGRTCCKLVLLMQYEFCCINVIGRSWRTWKTNQNYIHIALWFRCKCWRKERTYLAEVLLVAKSCEDCFLSNLRVHRSLQRGNLLLSLADHVPKIHIHFAGRSLLTNLYTASLFQM